MKICKRSYQISRANNLAAMKKLLKHKFWERLLFLSTLLLCASTVMAQIPNGDFETFNTGLCTPSQVQITDATAPFQEGCVSDWYASHGTPQIVEEDGNKYALMWAGDFFNAQNCSYNQVDGTEGIMMRCKFLRGERLTIAMDIKIATNSSSSDPSSMQSVRAYIANMSPTTEVHYCPGSTPLYELPWVPDKEIVMNLNNVTYSSWTTVSFTFQPTADYDWLWILPTDPEKARVLLVDNVRLVTCIENQTYTNNSNLPALTKRSDFIRAYNNVDVLNGQNVQFIAGKYIELNPGFEVKPGGVFTACIIDDCDRLSCGGEFPGKQEDPSISQLENLKSQIPTVYPNPSTGIFEMDNPQGLTVAYDILSLDGRQIQHGNSDGSKAIIDLQDQPKGLYFVRWSTSDGNHGTIKLIKN